MNLTLVKFTQQDFDDYLKLVSDEKVMAQITERAFPADEARADYDKMLRENTEHPDLGHFRVLKDGEFIGLGKLALDHEEQDQAELGYILAADYWGQGLGGQIAAELVAMAERKPKLKRLTAIIDPANIASRKILVRQGFTSKEFKDFDGLPGEILQRKL